MAWSKSNVIDYGAGKDMTKEAIEKNDLNIDDVLTYLNLLRKTHYGSGAPASPDVGMQFRDADDGALYWWNGATWVPDSPDLTGVIVNADINAAAAIALSKLASFYRGTCLKAIDFCGGAITSIDYGGVGSLMFWNWPMAAGASTYLFSFVYVPDDFVSGSVDISIFWKTTATSGDVLFNFLYQKLEDSATMALGSMSEVAFDADTADGTSEDIVITKKTAAWTPEAGKFYAIAIQRDGGDASDTCSSAINFLAASFE